MDPSDPSSGIDAASRPARFWAIAAMVVSLGFAAYTGHIWEDYFITFRASLNLATGHGLVFQTGERVHSFTSPLGTLLPALFALGGGDHAAIRALWGLRIVSALALGGALWIAVRAFQRDRLVLAALAAGAAPWVLDPKTVDFAMNGMETGLVVFGVTFTWHAFVSGARLWPCALSFAFLQWTRPDGCVYFGALAAAWCFVGGAGGAAHWRARVGAVLRGVAVGSLLYLPWVAWAWLYFGSPVPHTILAKVNDRSVGELVSLLALYPWRLLFGHVALHDLFLPAYFFFGGWPDYLHLISRVIAVVAATGWLWPRVPYPGRLASLAFFLGGFYVAYIPPSPWYFPGWQALGFLTWAYLLHALWQAPSARPRAVEWARRLVGIASLLLITLQLALLLAVAVQMRTQQTLIENQHRAEVGRWLRAHAGAQDTVFLECLGYIGYYSGLKMLDFPGLCAPEVVAARRAGARRWADLIAVLRPDWLVLRPRDATTVFSDRPGLQEVYTRVRTFNARAAIDERPLLPGRGYLNFDAVFDVYQGTRVSSPAP